MNKPQPGVDFINPYIDIPQAQMKRTNTEIAESDWLLLRSVRVQQGTFTTTNNILIWKLCNECRKRGYIDMSKHQEFERFVAGLVILSKDEYDRLCHGTTGRTVPETDGSNVSGRTQSKGGANTQQSRSAAVVRKPVGRGKK